MKATDPKNSPDPVSRPSNEEIETDASGSLKSTREKYAAADDHQLNSGIDDKSLRRKERQSNELGRED